MKRSKILVLIFIVFSSISSQAAKKYSVSTSITGSTDMKKVDAYDKYGDITASVAASYKLHRYWSTSLSTSFLKELTAMREERMGNASITMRRTRIPLSKEIGISTAVGTLIPLNKEQSDISSLQTMISVSPTLSYTPKKLPISVSYTQRLAKSFHRYETNAYGSNNTSYAISHIGSISYSPVEKISLSMYGSNTNRWSYKGSRKDDTFGLGQSISLLLGKKGSMEIGHEIGGKTFDYDGQQLDIDIYDSESSTIYLSLGYTI